MISYSSTIKSQSQQNSPGFILASAMVIMGAMLFLATGLFDFLYNETRLVTGQKLATQTYYLAEAGVQYAFWRLQQDPNLQDSFKHNPDWEINFNQNNLLTNSGSYTVTIKNQDLAQGTITATATLTFNNFSNQRVVKSKLFQAIA